VSTESFDAQMLYDHPFGCTVHRRGPTSEITLDGELDLAAQPTLDAAIVAALEPGPVDTVVADFTDVSFADSTTITWLLRADRRARAADARFVIVAGPGAVRDLLCITGLEERLTLVADARML
jgi:anti-sigma B factor antagonist